MSGWRLCVCCVCMLFSSVFLIKSTGTQQSYIHSTQVCCSLARTQQNCITCFTVHIRNLFGASYSLILFWNSESRQTSILTFMIQQEHRHIMAHNQLVTKNKRTPISMPCSQWPDWHNTASQGFAGALAYHGRAMAWYL